MPLRAGLASVSVPSKTYSILAAGRPVVAAIDPGTDDPAAARRVGRRGDRRARRPRRLRRRDRRPRGRPRPPRVDGASGPGVGAYCRVTRRGRRRVRAPGREPFAEAPPDSIAPSWLRVRRRPRKRPAWPKRARASASASREGRCSRWSWPSCSCSAPALVIYAAGVATGRRHVAAAAGDRPLARRLRLPALHRRAQRHPVGRPRGGGLQRRPRQPGLPQHRRPQPRRRRHPLAPVRRPGVGRPGPARHVPRQLRRRPVQHQARAARGRTSEFQDTGAPVADDFPLVYEEGETECDGEDAELKVVVWTDYQDPDSDQQYTSNFDEIPFDRDGLVIVIAFVPNDVDVVMPTWAAEPAGAGRRRLGHAAQRLGRATPAPSPRPPSDGTAPSPPTRRHRPARAPSRTARRRAPRSERRPRASAGEPRRRRAPPSERLAAQWRPDARDRPHRRVRHPSAAAHRHGAQVDADGRQRADHHPAGAAPRTSRRHHRHARARLPARPVPRRVPRTTAAATSSCATRSSPSRSTRRGRSASRPRSAASTARSWSSTATSSPTSTSPYLVAAHRRRGAVATLHLTPVDDPSAFGVVELDEGGRVRRFVEKPAPGVTDSNLINAGTYVMEPRRARPDRPGSPGVGRAGDVPGARRRPGRCSASPPTTTGSTPAARPPCCRPTSTGWPGATTSTSTTRSAMGVGISAEADVADDAEVSAA